MPILLAMLSAGALLIAPTNAKAQAQLSFDERLDAIHAVRQCYYREAASAPNGLSDRKGLSDKVKWLRGQCAAAEASDVAVWTKWLPDLKADIPAAAEHNHQVIAEEVAADPDPAASIGEGAS